MKQTFPDFLKKKLPNLIGGDSKDNNQDHEAVKSAVEKHNRLNLEEKIKEGNTSASIEAYIARLENIFLNPDVKVRQRNISLLRDGVYDKLIIKKENVPESYFELQKQIARDQGHGDIEISKEQRDRMIQVVIEDQKASLDAWIDYFSSDDAVYPTWFKYFAFKNIIKLSQFDKTLNKFKDRTDSTIAPFPDIYREPLAQLSDKYENYLADPKLKNDLDYKVFIEKNLELYILSLYKSH